MSEEIKPVDTEVTIEVNGQPRSYLMTSNLTVIAEKLVTLGCRPPAFTDYRLNPSLEPEVLKKMEELGVRYSMTINGKKPCINYFHPGLTPYVIYLNDLMDPWHKASDDGKTPSIMQQIRDLISLTGNWSPLMQAVENQDTDAVRFLLEAGADPNETSETGLSPLMIAVIKNNKEMVQMLLEKEAFVNAMTKEGWTPYRMAALMFLGDKTNRKEIAEILRKAGAVVDIKHLPFDAIHEKMTFHEKLNEYIYRATCFGRGKESLIYKRCNMDKRTYSKIKNTDTPNYHPRKNNVLALIIGMRLTLAEAEDLLASAGYAFAKDDEFDQIIKRHIKTEDFSINKIEAELYKKTGKSLGHYENEDEED